MGKKQKLQGALAFDQYYHALYKERWPQLKAALCGVKKSVALCNPFNPQAEHLLREQGALPHAILPMIWTCGDVFLSPSSLADQRQLLPYYLLDEASVWAARALELGPAMTVLDACAAPGGKSLVNIFWQQGNLKLTVGDRSRERVERMRRIYGQYLPPSLLASINFAVKDAREWYAIDGQENFEKWQRILLDAPCSSERHLLEAPNHMQDWAIGRSKRLAKDQFSMLCALWSCLRPDGQLVYSTCSISSLENEDIIQYFFEKRAGAEEINLNKHLPISHLFEGLSHGYLALPDNAGIGPIYMAAIKKAP
jgi:16S rRNA C967 or C1407 C5-methylase (RsmB/RsmF family)